MLVQTKHFGEIDLAEEKILTFDNGIMGFEEYKRYTILYDSEKEAEGKRPSISWLQCLDLKELAIPIINPLLVKEDYNPTVEDELLAGLGELTDENLVIFLTLTVPADITKMTSNLKAPIVINADTRKGCQIVAENADYQVRFPVYEQFKKNREEKEGNVC
ncbi:MAG: flagellar assembly protein FliW [Lachnospiraceae bacterium]|nr:flagellar assembly protein FliW [Lachnospiraceae bacterium]